MVRQQSSSPCDASSSQVAHGTTMSNDNRNQNTTPSEPRPHPNIDSEKQFNIDGTKELHSDQVGKNTQMPTSAGGQSHMSDSVAGAVQPRRNYMGNHDLSGLAGPRTMKRTQSSRNDFDRFVGNNELTTHPIDGKIGVHQFFGLESSY